MNKKTLLIACGLIISSNSYACLDEIFDYQVSDIYDYHDLFHITRERAVTLPENIYSQVSNEIGHIDSQVCQNALKMDFTTRMDHKSYSIYLSKNCKDASNRNRGLILNNFKNIIGYVKDNQINCLK